MGFDEVRALLKYWQEIPPTHVSNHVLCERVSHFIGYQPTKDAPKKQTDESIRQFAAEFGFNL